jgi:hypothetical protein
MKLTAQLTVFLIAVFSCSKVLAGAGVYPGSNFGLIPDGVTAAPLSYGAPRDILFDVQNRTGSINSVRVWFRANHGYVGDLKVQLIAPDGRSHLLFERTGASFPGDSGSGANLVDSQIYSFGDDFGALVGTNWWTAAGLADNDVAPAPLYRTVVSGRLGVVSPAPTTSMNETFRSAQPNGTWILRFEDGWFGVSGEVTDATLIIPDTGQTHVVTNPSDPPDGAGTLREALAGASAGDRIVFSEDLYANGLATIFVNQRLPPIPDGVAITGPGSKLLRIARFSASPFRIFHLPADRQATIQGVRIESGNEEGGFGGGIYSVGNLHLIDVDLRNNRALSGAGLFSDGRLSMLRSAVRENQASSNGGGLTIYPVDQVRISHTTVTDNEANSTGGGIFVLSQESNTEINISNSTIVANSAPTGPGIRQAGSGNSSVRLTSNLLSDQVPNLQVVGAHDYVSAGFNLVDDSGTGFLDHSGDQLNTHPGELVLDADSGLTPVLRLSMDSPALDAGIASDASLFDGRGEGFQRTVDLGKPNAEGSDGTDIGAFELTNPILFKSRFEGGTRR